MASLQPSIADIELYSFSTSPLSVISDF